jgi:hypothetical protein
MYDAETQMHTHRKSQHHFLCSATKQLASPGYQNLLQHLQLQLKQPSHHNFK